MTPSEKRRSGPRIGAARWLVGTLAAGAAAGVVVSFDSALGASVVAGYVLLAAGVAWAALGGTGGARPLSAAIGVLAAVTGGLLLAIMAGVGEVSGRLRACSIAGALVFLPIYCAIGGALLGSCHLVAGAVGTWLRTAGE
jgi:hypothetical protein